MLKNKANHAPKLVDRIIKAYGLFDDAEWECEPYGYRHKTAQVAEGLFASSSLSIIIGAGCKLDRGVILGNDVTLGANCELGEFAQVYSGCKLGKSQKIPAWEVVIGTANGQPFLLKNQKCKKEKTGFFTQKKFLFASALCIAAITWFSANHFTDKKKPDEAIAWANTVIERLDQSPEVTYIGIKGSKTVDGVLTEVEYEFRDRLGNNFSMWMPPSTSRTEVGKTYWLLLTLDNKPQLLPY